MVHGIAAPVTKMLDWLIRMDPSLAKAIIGETIGDAHRKYDTPHDVTAQSLRTALGLDGTIDNDTMADYLDRVLPPKPA